MKSIQNLLFLGVTIPNGDEKPLVKIGRQEFEGKFLIVPGIVVIFDQRRPAERLLGTVWNQRHLSDICN